MNEGQLREKECEGACACAAPEAKQRTTAPSTDIIDRKDGVVLLVDMPGVDPASLEVSVDKGVLHIGGRYGAPKPKNYELSYAEYAEGEYRRQFEFAETIDTDKIDAHLEKGVLRVFLPRKEKQAPKRIEVRA